MPHELHPTGVVEEPLQDDGLLRREHAQRGQGRPQVPDDGVRRGAVDRAFPFEPRARCLRVIGGQERPDLGSQPGDLGRKLRGPARSLSQPERHRRRGSVSVDDPHRPRFDPPDAP